MTRRHGLSAGRAVAIVVIGFVSITVLQILASNDWDPSVFAAFGVEAVDNTAFAEAALDRDVIVRPEIGHDGRFFFVQAVDPWIEDPAVYEETLDRPVYRAQRMLYPMLASGFGILPAEVVLWGMVVVNALALVAGSLALARLADAWGLSPWLALSFLVHPGLLAELSIGGAGILAMGLLVGALLAFERGSRRMVIVLLVGAVLAREVMLLSVAGLFVFGWIRRRRPDWAMLVVPSAAAVLWQLFIRIRLGNPSGGATEEITLTPFSGLLQAAPTWLGDPATLVISLLFVGSAIVVVVRCWRSDLSLTWAAVPFALLLPFLTAQVVGEYFNLARAVAPVLPAAAFELAKSRRDD